jgi:alpha-L-fucosidase
MIYHYEMNRREFVVAGTAAALSVPRVLQSQSSAFTHKLPVTDVHLRQVMSYVEDTPAPGYNWASAHAYEDFRDMKFGVRVHWGIYSVRGFTHESWPFLNLSNKERQAYNNLYKTWNPTGFDADEWASFFAESGARMFSFTSKHHEGFSMFDTRTRVRSRVNWTAPGGPSIEECDLAYSIMETPFRRDVVKELCDAARRHRLKIDLYFSHPDWYDADFRPYAYHPLQTPASIAANTDNISDRIRNGCHFTVVPEPSSLEVARMRNC